MGRLKIHGYGASVHKLASSADGTVSVALPTGQMNDAFAELTGIDVVKGLGLLLSQRQPNAAIRCGVIDFQAQQGTLAARSVFIDTTNVLITGRGHVDLGTSGSTYPCRATRRKSASSGCDLRLRCTARCSTPRSE